MRAVQVITQPGTPPQSALAGCQLPHWGAEKTSPERGGGPRVSVAEGFAVRRIPIGMHQGEFAEAKPQAPLKGELPPQRLRGAASNYLFAKTWANSYNSKRTFYVCARDFVKRWGPTAKPLSQAHWACQLPFQGRFSRCPLWGWCSAQRIEIAMIAGGNHTLVSCRAAAKGVLSVTLSHYHSTNDTPSVSPYGLPAPPLGSQVGGRQIQKKRGTNHGYIYQIVV